MEERLISSAIEYVKSLFADRSDGHDVEHTMRVYRNARLLADSEPECNRFMVFMAALLHDADDHKLFQTENNENARAFLERHRVMPETIERICEIINGVSFSQNRGKRPESIEGKIVQDADRLDAMGAIGISRTFAYGGKHGRSLSESIRHFEEKLLLLKDEMNTGEGKRMAEARHALLEDFLAAWKRETFADE